VTEYGATATAQVDVTAPDVSQRRLGFLDKEGNVVGEEDYYPVLPNLFSIGDNKPLKPNYVEDFGYTVEDTAPSAWDGRAESKITDIAFAESRATPVIGEPRYSPNQSCCPLAGCGKTPCSASNLMVHG
jgi:hypothetical protein